MHTNPENRSADAITGAWMSSPTAVTIPAWVVCSGISPQARALVTPLIIGAHRVHGDQAPVLDRQFLAWHVDGRRPDKLAPLLSELAAIGFLVIYDGGADAQGRRRKRRDPQTNAILPDVYALRFDPPEHYVGPRGIEEERQQYLADRDRAYGDAKVDGRKKVSRGWTGYLTPATNHQVKATPSCEGVDPEATPSCEGVEPFSQVKATPSCEGVDPEATPSCEGVEPFSQVKATPSQEGVSRARSSSGPSGPSGGEEGPEGGATAPAADAAAGMSQEHDSDDWARLLARDLPFSKKRGWIINPDEARKLAGRFRVAAETYGYTHEQIQQRALDALARSDGRGAVNYVLGAFKDTVLDREPVTESLPLPEVANNETCSSNTDTASAHEPDEQATGEFAEEELHIPVPVEESSAIVAETISRMNAKNRRQRRQRRVQFRRDTETDADDQQAS